VGTKNRFIFRGTVGGSLTGQFEQLPSSVRFFAGGAQSVRGFGYQALGPIDQNDKVVGGKHLVIGSVEYERRFAGKWGAAFFFDVGNAVDDFRDKLEQGAGVGIRWHSPVGPIRVDVASAIRREGYPLRLHINVGPDL
jgi:translocation and assembly module TamA